MRLFCWLGFHGWVRFFSDGPMKVDRCSHCEAKRSTMYDMTYGGTHWVPGDHWSPERRWYASL